MLGGSVHVTEGRSRGNQSEISLAAFWSTYTQSAVLLFAANSSRTESAKRALNVQVGRIRVISVGLESRLSRFPEAWADAVERKVGGYLQGLSGKPNTVVMGNPLPNFDSVRAEFTH